MLVCYTTSFCFLPRIITDCHRLFCYYFFATDYHRLPKITTDYFVIIFLPQIITDYHGLFCYYFFATDYHRLPRIILLLFFCHGLSQIITDFQRLFRYYFLPRIITDYHRLLRYYFFATDYHRLPLITSLLFFEKSFLILLICGKINFCLF